MEGVKFDNRTSNFSIRTTFMANNVSLSKAKSVKSIALTGDIDDVDMYVVVPPDGGWGWVIVVATFFITFLVDGIAYSFGKFLKDISLSLDIPKSQVAIIGSVSACMYYLTGPLVSALANKYGFRPVMIMGSCLCSTGYFLAGCTRSKILLYIFYGLFGGIGFSMIYTPSVIAVGFYFEKWRALATGLGVCGSGLGTLTLAPLSGYLLELYGWQSTFKIHSGILLTCIIFSSLYRPLHPVKISSGNKDDDKDKLAIKLGTVTSNCSETSVASYEMEEEKSANIKLNINQKIPPTNDIITELATYSGSRKPSEASFTHFTSILKTAGSFSSRSKLETMVSSMSRNSTRSENVYELGTLYEGVAAKFKTHKERRCGCMSCKCTNKTFTCTWNGVNVKKHFRRNPETEFNNVLGRPLYRDDIFFNASLDLLPQYAKSQVSPMLNVKPSIDYHMSVTRAASVRDFREDEERFKLCPRAFIRALATLLDTSLLRSPIFLLLAFSGFFTNLGLFIPYMYVTDRADHNHMTSNHSIWLLPIIGISNSLGRILCGMVSFLPGKYATEISYTTLFLGGLTTILSSLNITVAFQYCYCIVFGICIACMAALRPIMIVETVGLERLTNAIGLISLFQGFACLIGSPLAGLLRDVTGNYNWSFYFAGFSIMLSSILLLPLKYVNVSSK